MENTGLIFIPDISGFTKFVNETEIEHSRYIIEELLETIINSNQLGLSISEIEGDAVLFYKFGEPPTMPQLLAQAEKMFCEFHRHLRNYEYRRICQCMACQKAIDLSLKIITHYGEFSTYKVKDFSKLLGKDIILAHQLLKNDIDHHEYMLITDRIPTKNELNELPQWVSWIPGKKMTESGEVLYNYAMLTPLKQSIPPDPLPEFGPSKKIKVLSVSREFDADINDLFAKLADFHTRSSWMEGIKEVDQVSDKLPQIGTRHRCIYDKNATVFYTSSFSYQPDKIVYGESDEKKMLTCFFILEKTVNDKILLSFDLFMKKNPLLQLLFNVAMKKKMQKRIQRSMNNLQKLMNKPVVQIR